MLISAHGPRWLHTEHQTAAVVMDLFSPILARETENVCKVASVCHEGKVLGLGDREKPQPSYRTASEGRILKVGCVEMKQLVSG